MEKKKVILAYSGGLDTSVAIRWIQEKYEMDVIALGIDLGTDKDLKPAEEKALKIGAIKSMTIEAKEEFINSFIFPSLQAGALYEKVYPLATALGRPLIAKILVETAEAEGATAVAHGCTGKGNDQVRFDVAIHTLNPSLQIIAPLREWNMTRNDAIEYAQQNGIPVEVTKKSPYSIDENLWGRSIECGVLEDPWTEPPEEVYKWTNETKKTPDTPTYVEIGFERGIPVSINGKARDGLSLIQELNQIAGENGVGRIDHLENRVVGIKSREIYESPAAIVLFKAHHALEELTMTKDALRFKDLVSTQYSDIVYSGLWFSTFQQDLTAYVLSTQRFVTGTVRLRLFKSNGTVVGRKSPFSLYTHSLATYDKGDTFEHDAATGFIKIFGLATKTQAQVQQNAAKGEKQG
ncbi:MAG: argininosuccinate synthase [Candidatus Scalindua sp. AMX11]|nr:MAG: argininosuccinate synthase [Candidatus Scalindua sp.]NOG82883.1 argininosuccinate synthase [Planctomycetota bacterium]RZV86225.1 MAG: argininosuccinate synthase [Candidatus Scalindua sp. SCAELEC01]TDE65846.1 MAG: argininosuccinate synthase [Candidatus Scalindua sp. AMX11]GJQ58354.1 MAG: argininosuccinate synthase [Candidatus Scalindua sp.]